MRPIWIAALLVVTFIRTTAQPAFDRSYQTLHSHSRIQDKDFYFFTLLEQPQIRSALIRDHYFSRKLEFLKAMLVTAARDKSKSPNEVARYFEWTPEDIDSVRSALCDIILREPKTGTFLLKEIRSSGYWIRDAALSDTALLARAWENTAKAGNRLIVNYTTNKGFRYPAIDSATFTPNGPMGTQAMGETLMMLWHNRDSMDLFFEPTLELALDILFVNNRDEAARFEPLDSTNRLAYVRAQGIDWRKFAYSAILIPGEGPENDWPMSPMAKYRCELGAEAYRRGQAPFIIVSGGFVHPFQTPYCEADQMEAYLIKALGIPAGAVIVEPHARHTTTNFRNANRIVLRNGFPADKRVLCVSTAGQIGYIKAPFFSGRCQMELGYVPFRDLQQVDPFTLSYLPEEASLQLDATDPLDP